MEQMQFGSFRWQREPATLSIAHSRQVQTHLLPGSGTTVEDLGRRAAVITGEGVFVGADAKAQFTALAALQDKGTAVLRLPGLPPMMARLTKLEYAGAVQPEKAGYRFTFLEDPTAVVPETPFAPSGRYLAAEGEDLWHIAMAYGVAPEQLRQCNPQICWMGCLQAGQEVILP